MPCGAEMQQEKAPSISGLGEHPGRRSCVKKAVLVVVGNAGRLGADLAFFAPGLGQLAGVSGFHAVVKPTLPGGLNKSPGWQGTPSSPISGVTMADFFGVFLVGHGDGAVNISP